MNVRDSYGAEDCGFEWAVQPAGSWQLENTFNLEHLFSSAEPKAPGEVIV